MAHSYKPQPNYNIDFCLLNIGKPLLLTIEDFAEKLQPKLFEIYNSNYDTYYDSSTSTITLSNIYTTNSTITFPQSTITNDSTVSYTSYTPTQTAPTSCDFVTYSPTYKLVPATYSSNYYSCAVAPQIFISLLKLSAPFEFLNEGTWLIGESLTDLIYGQDTSNAVYDIVFKSRYRLQKLVKRLSDMNIKCIEIGKGYRLYENGMKLHSKFFPSIDNAVSRTDLNCLAIACDGTNICTLYNEYFKAFELISLDSIYSKEQTMQRIDKMLKKGYILRLSASDVLFLISNMNMYELIQKHKISSDSGFVEQYWFKHILSESIRKTVRERKKTMGEFIISEAKGYIESRNIIEEIVKWIKTIEQELTPLQKCALNVNLKKGKNNGKAYKKE